MQPPLVHINTLQYRDNPVYQISPSVNYPVCDELWSMRCAMQSTHPHREHERQLCRAGGT